MPKHHRLTAKEICSAFGSLHEPLLGFHFLADVPRIACVYGVMVDTARGPLGNLYLIWKDRDGYLQTRLLGQNKVCEGMVLENGVIVIRCNNFQYRILIKDLDL